MNEKTTLTTHIPVDSRVSFVQFVSHLSLRFVLCHRELIRSSRGFVFRL